MDISEKKEIVLNEEKEEEEEEEEEEEDDDDDNDILVEDQEKEDKELTYTVEDAIDRLGYGLFQIKLLLMIGFAWMADSMEITILAIMCPAIRCEWNLSTWAEALITTVVFAGMTVSTFFWGYVSDRYGRRKEVIWCTLVVFVGGFTSTFSPNYYWMVFLRGVVGVGMGGVAQCINLWMEFLPFKNRGGLISVLSLAWSFGTCLEIAIAVLVMPSLGWRWLLFLSSLPLIVFLGFMKYIPESPRFCISAGDHERALSILKTIAKDNKGTLPEGKLVASDTPKVHRGNFLDLFSANYRVSTILLWFIWFSSHFIIYGIALITTEMFSREDRCRGILFSEEERRIDGQGGCKQLGTHDYLHYFVVMSGDLLGLLLCFLTIDRLGRKKVQAIAFFFNFVFLALLFICTESRSSTTFFLYGSRLFISVADLAGYVYTPEVYPTAIRGIGLGACNGIARIGCMLTPYVAMVLMPLSVNISLSFYAGFAVLGVVACVMLPIETKDRLV